MCESYDDALVYADLLQETVSCKKVAIVVVFFIYLLYCALQAAIYFIEWKFPKGEKKELLQAFKNFKVDVETKNYFLLVCALLIQILTPNPFSVVMLFLYCFTYPVLFVGHIKTDKWKVRLIAYCIQVLFMIILLFELLIDPWCRHYYYRYVVGVPPDDYVTSPSSSSSTNTSNNGN